MMFLISYHSLHQSRQINVKLLRSGLRRADSSQYKWKIKSGVWVVFIYKRWPLLNESLMVLQLEWWWSHCRISLNIFLFFDSPVCASSQSPRRFRKDVRPNLAQMWRANWWERSWFSLGTEMTEQNPIRTRTRVSGSYEPTDHECSRI